MRQIKRREQDYKRVSTEMSVGDGKVEKLFVVFVLVGARVNIITAGNIRRFACNIITLFRSF